MPTDLSPAVRTVLLVHAAFGGVALLSGAVAMVATKGGQTHVRAGRVFVASMLVGIALSLPAIAARSNVLLGLVGPFSAWMVARGFRAFRVQRHGPTALDEALAWVPTVAGGALLALGAWVVWRTGEPLGFGAVAVGLGVVALRMGRSPTALADRRAAVRAHIASMVGGYIAATTAFVAVNGSGLGLPEVVLWLGPTAVGTPVIMVWSRRYAPLSAPSEVA